MQPAFHCQLRPRRRVIELLIDHGDLLLKLPEPFIAVARIRQARAHQPQLQAQIGGGGAAIQGEGVFRDGQGGADVLAGKYFLQFIVRVLAKTAAPKHRCGKRIQHRLVLRLAQLARTDPG